jgi:hypothetical protein
MPSHNIEIYTANADQAATESMLASVMGVAYLTVAQGSGRFVSLLMSDAQLASFKASVGSITSAKWYHCTDEEMFSRTLLDTNVAEALYFVDDGVYWNILNNQQANAGTAITARRDVAYAAPDGLSTNTGSIDSPLDLRSALVQAPIAAPVVYLRAGTHDITADTTITAAIQIRNYDGEDAYIRLVSPSSPTVRQLVIANTNTFFEANSAGMLRIGSDPSSRLQADQDTYPNIGRLDVTVTANEDGAFRGIYIHDLLTVAYQSPTGGKLFKDCVLWNFGYRWTSGEGGMNGEFMYIQNSGATEKIAADNVILGPVMGLMSQIYGQGGSISDVALNRVIGLSERALWASSAVPIQNLKLENSLLLHGIVLFGAGSQNNVNVTLRDNYLVARTESTAIGKWAGGDISNNVMVALGNNLLTCNVASTGVVYDYNTYYNPFNRQVSNGTGKTFAQWQAEGRDPHSTHLVAYPSNYIQVNPCESGSMVAFIGVSNIEELDTVEVDASGLGLVNGATYRLRQGYNPLNDYDDFVYDGSGTIEVNFVGRTIAIPAGDSVAIETLAITKGAWVLELVA